LVDPLIQGFAISEGGTPDLIGPFAALLQDQDEKGWMSVADCRRIQG